MSLQTKGTIRECGNIFVSEYKVWIYFQIRTKHGKNGLKS